MTTLAEVIFQITIWAYPGLAVVYGFWALLSLGGKNTLPTGRASQPSSPDWLTGVHFTTQSVAFYLLYFATKDLPITNSNFSFIIRVWWTCAFLSALIMTIWHFGTLARRQWTARRGASNQTEGGPTDGS